MADNDIELFLVEQTTKYRQLQTWQREIPATIWLQHDRGLRVNFCLVPLFIYKPKLHNGCKLVSMIGPTHAK